MKKTYLRFLLIIPLLILAGCAVYPIMSLQHLPRSGGYDYASKGSITVKLFDDNRPLHERPGGKQPLGSKKIWSQRTTPAANEFLQQVIIREIQESGVFNISQDEEAEYELSGKIKSLKVERKMGTMALFALPFRVLGYVLLLDYVLAAMNDDPLADEQESTIIMAGAIISLSYGAIIGLVNSDPLIATVAYNAVLKKNGEVVWEDTIIKKHDEIMWTPFKGRNKSSDICAALLDKSITISVRRMLKYVNEKI